jgi:hypothetical protein
LATEQGTSIGRTVTLLMIFAITVIAIVVIFAYFNGLFKFVSEGGTGSVTVSGIFALSGGGGSSGSLVIQVTDTGNEPVVGIALSCPTSQFATQNCGGLQMNYKASPVSSANPVSKGDFASGTQEVHSASGNSFTAGTDYQITVNVTFADGSTVSQIASVPAQV